MKKTVSKQKKKEEKKTVPKQKKSRSRLSSKNSKRKLSSISTVAIILGFLGGLTINLFIGLNLKGLLPSDEDKDLEKLLDTVLEPGNEDIKKLVETIQDAILVPSSIYDDDEMVEVQSDAKPPVDNDLNIAWLMSFPNSGTTYTLKFVNKSTGKRIGTNYIKEAQRMGAQPIFKDQPQGPFWAGQSDFPTPGEHVLTKTHCGGYSPDQDIERTGGGRFILECAMGRVVRKDISEAYPLTRVKKAVHLVRDPFANVVARFHNRFKDPKGGGDQDFKRKYGKARKGFRKFCSIVDESFQKLERLYLSKGQVALLKDVPCSSEFVFYVLWHNNAFKGIEMVGIETMILHYHSFETDFEETSDSLLAFLGYPKSESKLQFVSGKTYDDYFRPKERVKVKKVLQELASKETWAEIERYF